ncbi:hypothetical protein [Paracoccus aerodenitrificans]|uniref:hypothetical protein n=1 Tax=Paracoccus aerodenitrificans TaxID=3017781 RepID=UPI0022F079D3|nr:hypothetical protein [Paracoccus aerodenitrificans]WBU65272.1 hypothetical protein PAE61_07600 [Paracoccus aerodenitrificans]
MAVIRLAIVLFIIEAVFYVLISVYLRSTKAESLEDEWDRRHPDRAGNSPERRKFVQRSMTGFQKTLKARLVALVFVVPTVAIVVIAWAVNVQ